jgi:hypothetical protein
VTDALIGGAVVSTVHIDGRLLKPTIELDDVPSCGTSSSSMAFVCFRGGS